jgi:tetratricopeptide (TPR) repeat protein
VLHRVPEEEYSRAYVRRRFGLSERQLRSWERQDLLPATPAYSFSDLIAIKTLVMLRDNRIPPRQIGRAVESLRRKLSGVRRPLSELRILSNGKRIAVQVAGQRMDALSGQILIDFEASELGAMRDFPSDKQTANRARESELWFQKGLALEEAGAPAEEAIAAYQNVIALNPTAAGALLNLGTIFYRQRKFRDAEQYYVRAIAADPSYPLAEFNLGNLYDEQGRLTDAHAHYRRALELNPNYADAHFNIALLSERLGDTLRAVHHWKVYLKLDATGQWADIARRQLDRLRQLTVISR